MEPGRSLSHLYSIVGLSDERMETPTRREHYEELDSNEKRHVNEVIIGDTLANHRASNGSIIILDGPNMCTTFALLRKGVEPLSIVVIERHEKTHWNHVELLAPAGVQVVHGDLFEWLRSTPRHVYCVVADLMQPALSLDELETLASLSGIRHLFITLSGRDRLGRSLASRIEAIRDHRAFDKAFPSLTTLYGYSRKSPMYVAHFTSEIVLWTDYRPQCVHETRGNQVLVQWYGYPQRRHWTWEHRSVIET